MSSVNTVILVGNLGADPEMKTTSGGKMVANFSLATSKSWTSGTGERQEKTAWHRVVVWGKQAELVQRFLAKGRKVCIQGEIDYRTWDKPDGTKGYATDIVANQVTFLDSGASGARDGQGAGHGGGGYGQGAPAGDEWGGDDGVPF